MLMRKHDSEQRTANDTSFIRAYKRYGKSNYAITYNVSLINSNDKVTIIKAWKYQVPFMSADKK